MLEAKKRIVSIDYGLKRLGIAISDENKIIASSLGVIQAGKNHAETVRNILNLLKPYDLERIIIGYPIHMNGITNNNTLEIVRFKQI